MLLGLSIVFIVMYNAATVCIWLLYYSSAILDKALFFVIIISLIGFPILGLFLLFYDKKESVKDASNIGEPKKKGGAMKEYDIENSILMQLPLTVKHGLSEVSGEKRIVFVEEFLRKKRALGCMLALAILFPIQHFLLGRGILGIIFWISGFGIFIWWIVEIFLTPSRVRTYNEELASQILRDIVIMSK